MLNFVVVLRFVQIYALFGRFGAEVEVYFYMVQGDHGGRGKAFIERLSGVFPAGEPLPT